MNGSRETVPVGVVLLSMVTALLAAAQYYPNLPPQPPYNYHAYQAPLQQPAQYHPGAYPNQAPTVHQHFYPAAVYRNITNSTYQIKGHDFVMGGPTPNEKVLLHTTVYKKPGIWSSYATKEITFPPRGSHVRVNITRITATDRAKNGTGAFLKLVSGGVGHQNVTLLFKSQRNQPINFQLDIYGQQK